MKPQKALVISMSVGCIVAYQKFTHQGTGFRLPMIRCQSADPKKNSADLRPRGFGSAVRQSAHL